VQQKFFVCDFAFETHGFSRFRQSFTLRKIEAQKEILKPAIPHRCSDV